MRCLAAKSAIASPPAKVYSPRAARCAWASPRSRPPGCGSGGRYARPAWVGQLHRRDRRAEGHARGREGAAQRGHRAVLGEGRRHQGRQATQAQGQWGGGKLTADKDIRAQPAVADLVSSTDELNTKTPEVVAQGRPGVPGVGREFRTARRAPGLQRAVASRLPARLPAGAKAAEPGWHTRQSADNHAHAQPQEDQAPGPGCRRDGAL